MNFFDWSLLFFFFNFALVVFIFWFLTFLGSFFFLKKETPNKCDFYECGFRSFADLNFNLNYGSFVVMVLTILYDIEISFLIPYLLNSGCVSVLTNVNFVYLYICILFTVLVDLFEDIISWDY